MTIVYWFRRDLRTQDSEALNRAVELAGQDQLAAVFSFPADFDSLSPIRQHSLLESVKSLRQTLGGSLSIRLGAAEANLVEFARSVGASRVIATRGFDTTSMLEQSAVAEKLFEAGIALELVGSNYVVPPGTIRKDDGTAVRVYTPFFKRWLMQPHPRPLQLDVTAVNWLAGDGDLPKPQGPAPFQIRASEAFALSTLERFVNRALSGYDTGRDRTDLPGTSHLSHALAHGEIHPRTILARIGSGPGTEVFRKEIAWREFYADVLFNNPHTLTDYYEPRFANLRYDSPEANAGLQAWYEGRTGYPIVDAAMRQLATTGWMHNRARMIVASFLVKDLHIEWQVGASWFERWLTDFDPASNAHGWQWTAGCGTDASPYFRVFNPVLQGMKFDPEGNYVRKYIPELAHIPGAAVHEPWKLIDGLSHGYPAPILDHSRERDEALARLAEIKR